MKNHNIINVVKQFSKNNVNILKNLNIFWFKCDNKLEITLTRSKREAK